MGAKDDSALLNSPCNENELRIDSTTEYCAQWLATISAARPDESRHLSPAALLSRLQSEEDSPSYPGSPHAAHEFSRRATHHHNESPALPPTTPSSAPSPMDATPRPEAECLATIPYSESPRMRADGKYKYEKRPRRKTRPDRYDTSRQHREKTALSRRERREQRREKLRSRKEIMTRFYSSATENRNVLLKPALATGAFVNGRGSVPTPLADLTFNELTFPITQKPAPRAASPQPPNGARKRPSVQSSKVPEQIQKTPKKTPKEAVVIEACPETSTPLPRQDHAKELKQSQRLNDNTGGAATRNEDARPRYTTPRPIIRYVDSGVDAMSAVANLAGDELEYVRDVQRPPVEPQYAEQANLYAPYYNHTPAHMPYYEPSYCAKGIYEQAGLQPGSDWLGHALPHYPSQHVYNMAMQPGIIDYDRQNKDNSYLAPTSDTYPVPSNSLTEYIASSPVHEPEPLFKPDEETKAFWRPNFLR